MLIKIGCCLTELFKKNKKEGAFLKQCIWTTELRYLSSHRSTGGRGSATRDAAAADDDDDDDDAEDGCNSGGAATT